MVAHASAPLGAELAPELLKVRQTATAIHHGLAVDDRAVCFKPLRARCDGRELFGPVQPCTRIDFEIAIFDVELRAVAVRFDLVDPTQPVVDSRAAWGHTARCNPE